MNEDVAIAGLADDEIDLLHSLMDEFVSSHASLQYRDNYWPLLRGWLLKIKNEEDSRLLVARFDGKIIGFALAQIKDNDPLLLPEKIGYGHIMVIAPEFRKEGIGDALWNAMREWFVSKSTEQVETFTEVGNAPAEDFWESHGFSAFLHKRRCHVVEH